MSADDTDDLASRAVALAANLPAPVAAGGLKAISRLIGGLADYPAAWLRRASQSVEDKTNAKTLVSNAIAIAVAERAVSDPALVERSMASFIGKAARHQINREAVAEQAAEALREEQPNESLADPIGEPEDDWLNVFERYAEDASSERARILWGRVLAGEIRKPRSFSLATLRFLSEADQRTVQIAQQVSGLMVCGLIFQTDSMGSGTLFATLLEAQAAGLISGVGTGIGGTQWKPTIGPAGRLDLIGRSFVMRIEGSTGHQFSVPVLVPTRVGMEVSNLSPATDEVSLLQIAADIIKTDTNINAIHIGARIGEQQMVYPSPYWIRPVEGASSTPFNFNIP